MKHCPRCNTPNDLAAPECCVCGERFAAPTAPDVSPPVPGRAGRAMLVLGIGALLLSLWPGLLATLVGIPLVLLVGLGLPLVVVLGALDLGVWVASWVRPGARPPPPDRPVVRRSRRPLVVAAIVVALLVLAVPRRLALLVSLPWLVPVAEDIEGPDRAESARWLGLFRVDAVRRDAHGGVYLRTWRRPDFVDTWSYGLAWRPDEARSPFGGKGYARSHLLGDWYSFVANDDS